MESKQQRIILSNKSKKTGGGGSIGASFSLGQSNKIKIVKLIARDKSTETLKKVKSPKEYINKP
jgi:hypothetical protein